MSSAANELMWIKQLCTDLSITTKKPTLWGDNKSANLLAGNPISSDRSKHIRVRHLRVREYVEHEEMDVQWVGTKEMLANGFTKTLPGPSLSVEHVQACKLLHEGLISIRIMLTLITHGNLEHCAHALILMSALLIQRRRIMLNCRVHAHSMLLCKRRRDKDMPKLLDCPCTLLLQEYSVHAGT